MPGGVRPGFKSDQGAVGTGRRVGGKQIGEADLTGKVLLTVSTPFLICRAHYLLHLCNRGLICCGAGNRGSKACRSLAAATAAAAPTYVREQAMAALRLNVEPQIIKEAVYQTAPYVGFPKAEAALNEINALFEERGIKLAAESLATVSEADRFDKGRDLQVGAYGERILKMHREAQPEESYLSVYLLSSFCFGDIYTRNGLDMKTRELLTFSAIAVIGGAEGQLTGHTIANFNEGNSKQDLMDTIALCLPYMGFPRSLNALAVIKKVEAERNAGK